MLRGKEKSVRLYSVNQVPTSVANDFVVST